MQTQNNDSLLAQASDDFENMNADKVSTSANGSTKPKSDSSKDTLYVDQNDVAKSSYPVSAERSMLSNHIEETTTKVLNKRMKPSFDFDEVLREEKPKKRRLVSGTRSVARSSFLSSQSVTRSDSSVTYARASTQATVVDEDVVIVDYFENPKTQPK